MVCLRSSQEMLSHLWVVLLFYLVPSPWVITSAFPSVPNPNGKAAFSQILQANMEIERDCRYFFIEDHCKSK